MLNQDDMVCGFRQFLPSNGSGWIWDSSQDACAPWPQQLRHFRRSASMSFNLVADALEPGSTADGCRRSHWKRQNGQLLLRRVMLVSEKLKENRSIQSVSMIFGWILPCNCESVHVPAGVWCNISNSESTISTPHPFAGPLPPGNPVVGAARPHGPWAKIYACLPGCSSIHPSVHPSIHLTIWPSICWSNLCMKLSWSIYPIESNHTLSHPMLSHLFSSHLILSYPMLSVCLSACLPVCLSIHPPIHPSIDPSIYLSISNLIQTNLIQSNLSIHLSVLISAHLCLRYLCLSVLLYASLCFSMLVSAYLCLSMLICAYISVLIYANLC